MVLLCFMDHKCLINNAVLSGMMFFLMPLCLELFGWLLTNLLTWIHCSGDTLPCSSGQIDQLSWKEREGLLG